MVHPGTSRNTAAVAAAFARRSAPTHSLSVEATAIVRACGDMAERFRRGGALLSLGNCMAATDAQHIAVEFVHPVLVGKRALASRYLADPHQVPVFARADDIVLAVAPGELDDGLRAALREARDRGLLTIALVGTDGTVPGADHVLRATGSSPLVVQEMQVTTYHLLWELAQVHLERGDVVSMPQRRTDNMHTGNVHTDELHTDNVHTDDACITCADEAVPVRIVRMLGNGLARVETGSGTEEVSVALVDAAVGDTVLVHAREAIGVVAR